MKKGEKVVLSVLGSIFILILVIIGLGWHVFGTYNSITSIHNYFTLSDTHKKWRIDVPNNHIQIGDEYAFYLWKPPIIGDYHIYSYPQGICNFIITSENYSIFPYYYLFSFNSAGNFDIRLDIDCKNHTYDYLEIQVNSRVILDLRT